MGIELEKLAPAPWHVAKDHETGTPFVTTKNGYPLLLPEHEDREQDLTALEFAALARNAFDVMMRRGWCVFKELDGWSVGNSKCIQGSKAADPFTALVEADAWYKENVEAAHAGEKAEA